MMCGEINKVLYACVEITQNSWAPGIWAGVTEVTVEVRNKDGKHKGYLEVTYCDLENRKVYHKVEEFPFFNVEQGDTLHHPFYVVVEN